MVWIENAFKAWLSNTTCTRKELSIYWISECDNFAIFRHNGHRKTKDGTRIYCPTSYSLYSHTCDHDPCGIKSLYQTEGGLRKEEKIAIRAVIQLNTPH